MVGISCKYHRQHEITTSLQFPNTKRITALGPNLRSQNVLTIYLNNNEKKISVEEGASTEPKLCAIIIKT